MLGLIDNVNKVTTSHFKKNGDTVFLLGNVSSNEIGGSEYLELINSETKGDAPDINLDNEKKLQNTVLELIDSQLINSAHDISEGGLAVALSECCIMNSFEPIGCKIKFDYINRRDFELFGETQSRIIISADESNANDIFNVCEKHKTQILNIGFTGGDNLIINDEIEINLKNLIERYYNSIERIMENNF